MQKQRKIKIGYAIFFIILAIFVFSYLGVFLLKKQLINKVTEPVKIEKKDIDITVKEKDEFGRKIIQTRSSDPDCTDGVYENIYYGEIKKDMPVKIVLSCDQERFNIVGSVTQLIDSTNGVDLVGDDVVLVDISSGSQVVYVEDDYNFDGYNDLSAISSNGQGFDGVDSFNIFLYNPKIQKFVYNAEISKLQNSLMDTKNKNQDDF